jgi:hypothetical protein
MKDYEAIAIAKIFRNTIKDKENLSETAIQVANYIVSVKQFFDRDRFIAIANNRLDE